MIAEKAALIKEEKDVLKMKQEEMLATMEMMKA